MDRLTRKINRRYGVVPGYELDTLHGARKVVNRLAAYENTGLEPEEVAALREQEAKCVEIEAVKPLTLDELRELDGEPVFWWILFIKQIRKCRICGLGGFL